MWLCHFCFPYKNQSTQIFSFLCQKKIDAKNNDRKKLYSPPMQAKFREIKTIYTIVDGYLEILFKNDPVPSHDPNQRNFFRPYTRTQIANVFRIMGCQMPLDASLSDWIFSFLERSTDEQAQELLHTEKKIFQDKRSCSHQFIILTRNEFHRLVCASLYVHQFRKIRYSVDFRLALDFIEERRFFIILLSGAPGTGKSTIASLLASRMSVSHIISTDSIRHAMRTIYPKDKYPILHYSTYECGDIVDPEHKLPEEERVCIFLMPLEAIRFLWQFIFNLLTRSALKVTMLSQI